MIKIKKKINDFLSLLKESLDIPTFIINNKKEIVFSNNDDKIAETLLLGSDIFKLFDEHGQSKNPVIIGSILAIMWFIVFDNDNEYTYILGPVASSSLNQITIKNTLNDYDLPFDFKYNLIDYLEKLPIYTFNTLFPYCVSLHYLINDEKIDNQSIEILSTQHNDGGDKKIEPTKSRMRTWKTEQLLMKNIEEGNLDFKSTLNMAREISYGVQSTFEEPILQMKNSVLIFITLSVRAAIKGGLSPEHAYSMGDNYISQIEKCDSMDKLTSLANNMYETFIKTVHDNKENNNYSDIVRNCMSYIDLRLEKPINLDELASDLSYSTYYLTKKFKKETGNSIKEYINNKKINLAKIYLETSDLLIKEISNRLCFDSETYFSTVFSKIVGTSPLQYRNNINK